MPVAPLPSPPSGRRSPWGALVAVALLIVVGGVGAVATWSIAGRLADDAPAVIGRDGDVGPDRPATRLLSVDEPAQATSTPVLAAPIRLLELPDGLAWPRPDPDEPPFFEDVTARRAAVRLTHATWQDGVPPRAAVEDVRAVEGVAAAAALEVATLPLALGEGARESVSVAVVDPVELRPLTPQVTADAVDVWRRIVEGDGAFTHDVGHELKIDHDIALGDRVPVADGTRSLRIGAYASNGVPPVAEVLISRGTAGTLDVSGRGEILVAADDDVDAAALAVTLEAATGLTAEVIPEPPTRRAFLDGGDAREAFEPFTYVSLGDGMIEIDPAWVRRNIETAEVPVFRGPVTCHRLMIPQLRGALQEVVDRGLDHLIDVRDYGGCWVPRHILFDRTRSLSMHAWGLAVDFNVSTNQYGAEPQMDRRIVEIFERWGFAWGGHWRTPDGMHFELSALLVDEVH